MGIFRRNPVPPADVRVIDTDGRDWPVQVVYAGRRRGLDVWDVVDQPVGRQVASVHLERLDHATWWIGLTLPDGTRIDVDLGVTPFARERHVTTTPEGDTR